MSAPSSDDKPHVSVPAPASDATLAQSAASALGVLAAGAGAGTHGAGGAMGGMGDMGDMGGMGAGDGLNIVSGDMLGQYKIIEKIGEGGMGLVFKATDTTLERTVAVKVMYCDAHEDQKRAQRFVREARAMARLAHPNLLHVYSVGSRGNCHFFAMELLRGETLLHAIHRLGRIPAPDMMHYAVQVVSALYYVHRNGIIHRDIKGGNIMLCGRRAVLMDFGLAKEVEDSGLTSVGAIMGTPDYMPPEAAEGRSEGPPTDIYSLGVVLYEALSGRLPFMGKSAISIIRQHIDSQPPPLEALVPEIKPELAAVIHKCMAKLPSERYADCPALAAALWDLLPDQALLDVAEGRLPDTDAMPLEHKHFGAAVVSSSAANAFKNRKTGPNAALEKTLLPLPTTASAFGATQTGIQKTELNFEPLDANQPPARGRSAQWLWALAGFAGVFALLIVLALALKPKSDAVVNTMPFRGQQVVKKSAASKSGERDVLMEFKGNDPDPKNWYFVVRRKQPDGTLKDLKLPYREYVPAKEEIELQFLPDDAQSKP